MSDFRTLATIKTADNGGFTAVASTGSIDRDGEIVAFGAFEPLPASVPVHLDHTMSAATVVARAVPKYVGGQLQITAKYGSTPDAQLVRQKVLDGLIDSMSIVAWRTEYDRRADVPTIVKGELLAVDLVTIPSNLDALITSAKSFGASADSVLAMAWAELADAQRVLSSTAVTRSAESVLAEARAVLADAERVLAGPARSRVDAMLRSTLNAGPAQQFVDDLLADALDDSRKGYGDGRSFF